MSWMTIDLRESMCQMTHMGRGELLAALVR